MCLCVCLCLCECVLKSGMTPKEAPRHILSEGVCVCVCVYVSVSVSVCACFKEWRDS